MNLWRAFLVLTFCSLLSGPAHADDLFIKGYTPTCDQILERVFRPELRRAQIFEALKNYRPGNESPALQELHDKMVPILAEEIVQDLRGLGKARWEHAVKSIAKPEQLVDDADLRAGVRHIEKMASTLEFSKSLLSHPLGLVLLRHEVRHMKQNWFLVDSFLNYKSDNFLTWNLVLKVESDAHTAERDFFLKILSEIPETKTLLNKGKTFEVNDSDLSIISENSKLGNSSLNLQFEEGILALNRISQELQEFGFSLDLTKNFEELLTRAQGNLEDYLSTRLTATHLNRNRNENRRIILFALASSATASVPVIIYLVSL